jgi:hypothetical protein
LLTTSANTITVKTTDIEIRRRGRSVYISRNSTTNGNENVVGGQRREGERGEKREDKKGALLLPQGDNSTTRIGESDLAASSVDEIAPTTTATTTRRSHVNNYIYSSDSSSRFRNSKRRRRDGEDENDNTNSNNNDHDSYPNDSDKQQPSYSDSNRRTTELVFMTTTSINNQRSSN